jgi:hypothetical protein
MALVTRAGSRLSREVVPSSIDPVCDVRVGRLLILVGALLVAIARGLILVGRRLVLITARLVLIRRALVTAELESLAVVTQRFITHGLPPRKCSADGGEHHSPLVSDDTSRTAVEPSKIERTQADLQDSLR